VPLYTGTSSVGTFSCVLFILHLSEPLPMHSALRILCPEDNPENKLKLEENFF